MEKKQSLIYTVLHDGYRLFLEKNHDAKELFLFDQVFTRLARL
jgi:hypothetical protein